MNGIYYVARIQKKEVWVNASVAPLLLFNIMLAATYRENAKNLPKICDRKIPSSDNCVPRFHFCNLSIKHWSSLLFQAKMECLVRILLWSSVLTWTRVSSQFSGRGKEVFFVNLEEGFFGCQVNETAEVLQIFKINKLCDGVSDCFRGSDENSKELKCSSKWKVSVASVKSQSAQKVRLPCKALGKRFPMCVAPVCSVVRRNWGFWTEILPLGGK